MFVDAWRLERDYFYDRGMHGAAWNDVRKKYEPLVDRVASRADLNDLIAQMVGELSALHTFVNGGDRRKGPDDVPIATLGARLERVASLGGYKIAHIYQHDPDEPSRASPLARPGVNLKDGDLILEVNGVAVLETADIGELLRKKAGQPVLLKVKCPLTATDTGLAGAMARRIGFRIREVTVRPIASDSDLRYHEWEYTRRTSVDDGEQQHDRLRASAGDGQRRLQLVRQGLLSGVHAARNDHRRAPQSRRQHR